MLSKGMKYALTIVRPFYRANQVHHHTEATLLSKCVSTSVRTDGRTFTLILCSAFHILYQLTADMPE